VASLFAAITDWDNLWRAYRLAARGKRRKDSAAAFEQVLADRLIVLQSALRTRSYRPGAYRHFFIHEPKRRKISAAPFVDRVVHHALCNVIEPICEAGFIAHSYANRRGKGTHRAVDRLQELARRHRYVLRADIVQHFPSLDHSLLRAKLARLIEDEEVLWLVDSILASGVGALTAEYTPVYFPGDDLLAACRPRGLPIGNLTSQFWSNVFLNDFDWFVQRELGCGAYLRYVDDFALFAEHKRQLWAWKAAIVEHLAALRLTLHQRESIVYPVSNGIPFLGFRVYPDHRRLKRRNGVAFARRLRLAYRAVDAGAWSHDDLRRRIKGWIAHASHGDTWRLRRSLLAVPVPRRSP